jgi:teichuronic acid biosynthesis glycosyltransferase TuaC
MKVLFVYSAKSVTGQNNIVENQASSLFSKEIDIKLFPLEGKGITGYLRNIKDLSKFLKTGQIDIIHAHYGLSGIVSFIAKKREKLIVSFMGSDLIGSKNLSEKLLTFINIIFARLFYDISIVKSAQMFARLSKSTHVVLIPNGTSLERYGFMDQMIARNEAGLQNTANIVLFVSDPSRPEKNFSLADEAVHMLREIEITLLPIFDKPADALKTFYNAADLLLLTSFHEGSPNVVKEAMACNCPVVATNVGDVEWLFGDSPGYYISTFNPEDVADKIKQALEFRKVHIMTRGRERILELGIDSDKIAEKIVKVYEAVLND